MRIWILGFGAFGLNVISWVKSWLVAFSLWFRMSFMWKIEAPSPMLKTWSFKVGHDVINLWNKLNYVYLWWLMLILWFERNLCKLKWVVMIRWSGLMVLIIQYEMECINWAFVLNVIKFMPNDNLLCFP